MDAHLWHKLHDDVENLGHTPNGYITMADACARALAAEGGAFKGIQELEKQFKYWVPVQEHWLQSAHALLHAMEARRLQPPRSVNAEGGRVVINLRNPEAWISHAGQPDRKPRWFVVNAPRLVHLSGEDWAQHAETIAKVLSTPQ